MIFLVSVVIPVDITKWVNIPGALFYLIILPGLMYIWSAKGFKEKRPVYFWLMDAFMVGLLIFVFTVLIWSSIALISHHYQELAELLAGLMILVLKGMRVLLEKPVSMSSVTLYVVLLVYGSCITGGFLTRLSNEGRFPPWRRRRKPKIFADSFLDAELLRLREKKIVPQVVLTLKSGEKIRGNCYSYTFTAPREIAIDLYSDEQTERHIVIVKLDENVERLELIFAELPEERRGPFTIVKRLTRCRRAAVISSMEENCWPS